MSWVDTVVGLNVVSELNSQKNENYEQGRTISDQQDEIAKLKRAAKNASPSYETSSTDAWLIREGEEAKKKLAEIENALKSPDYKQMLAKISPKFREHYIEEQKVVTEWLWEQKAFHETVMDFGGDLGKSKDEVLAAFESAKQAVYAGTAKHTDGLTEENKKALGGMDAVKAEDDAKKRADQEYGLREYLNKMERLEMPPTPERIAKFPPDIVEKVMGAEWEQNCRAVYQAWNESRPKQ